MLISTRFFPEIHLFPIFYKRLPLSHSNYAPPCLDSGRSGFFFDIGLSFVGRLVASTASNTGHRVGSL
jgi:hypothetical protein